MDPVTISLALGSVKTAIDIAKSLKDTDSSLEQAEAKIQLAELLDALADTKMQIADFKELLLAKDEENKKLIKELAIQGNLEYEKPYYWLIENEKKDGPYCQQCYDNNNKLIRLQDAAEGQWLCQTCKVSVWDD